MLKVLAQAFFKRLGGAAALGGRARKRETNAQRRSVAPLFACGGVRRFFFAQPDGACASALSAAKHVFIAPTVPKKKAGDGLR